jgi:hypothetical protein
LSVVGDEAAFLPRVPVYLLRGAGVSAELIEKLKRFGLKTLGDVLLRTTSHNLKLQFGKQAQPLLELLNPPSSAPIPVFMPPTSIRVSWTFDPTALEPFEWQPVLELLIARALIELANWFAGTVTVTLTSALGESAARQVLKVYTNDAKTLLNSATRCVLNALNGLEIEVLVLMLSDVLKPISRQDNLFAMIERPNVREALQTVHQHHPEKLGKLEVHRPNAPLREQQFQFTALDGQAPRVKRNANPSKPKTSRKS